MVTAPLGEPQIEEEGLRLECEAAQDSSAGPQAIVRAFAQGTISLEAPEASGCHIAHLIGVVEDNASGVSLPGSEATHAVAKIDAIGAARSLDWPMVYCKSHRVALAERDDLRP